MVETLGKYISEYSVKNKNGADIPVYSVSNERGFCRDYFNKDVSSKDKTTYKIVPRGFFAYNPSRINVGSVDWQNKEELVIVSPLYVVFTTKGLDNDYLLYYLKSDALMSYIRVYSAGSVRNNLRFKTLASFPVRVPSLECQKEIVGELNCITHIIQQRKLQLKELDKLVESVFFQMFGDPIANEKQWDVAALEEMVTSDCSISYGIVQPGEGEEEGVPIIRPVDLISTVTHNVDLKKTTPEISNAYKRTILKGDELLLCVRGTTGVVSLAGDDLAGCNVSRGISPLAFPDGISKWFMLYQFKTSGIQHIIAELTHGIALKGINMADVRKLQMINPPSELQTEFEKKSIAIYEQRLRIEESIQQLECLLNSRMDHWFN